MTKTLTEKNHPNQAKYRKKLNKRGLKGKYLVIPVSLESEFEAASRRLREKYQTFHALFCE